MFATVVLVAGSFVGCTDVDIDDPSCGTCPPPAATFDTAIVDAASIDTSFARETMTIVIEHRIDTTITNLQNNQQRHSYDTIVNERVVPRPPVRDVTIFMKNRKGQIQPVSYQLHSLPLEIGVDRSGFPRTISFEVIVPVGRLLSDVDFDKKDIGDLYISLPETAYSRFFKLDKIPGFGPGAWIGFGDKQLATGSSSGGQPSTATLEVKNPMLRQRVMDLLFEGTFRHPSGSPNETITVNVHFRTNY